MITLHYFPGFKGFCKERCRFKWGADTSSKPLIIVLRLMLIHFSAFLNVNETKPDICRDLLEFRWRLWPVGRPIREAPCCGCTNESSDESSSELWCHSSCNDWNYMLHYIYVHKHNASACVCELLCKSPQCDMWYDDALFPRMEIRSNRLTGCRAESGCTSVCTSITSTHLNILNFCLKLWHYKWKPTPTQRQKLLLLTY